MGDDIGEQVLSFVGQNGPALPSEVAKFIGKDILIASAILSELVSRKVLKISKAKIGGSPVYYLPGQEEMLERLLPFMNEKDRQTCIMLKERGVIGEEEADPLTRVSLKSLPDFAIPFQLEGKTYWRWHLLPEGEAAARAGQKIAGKEFRRSENSAAAEKPKISIAQSIESAITSEAKIIEEHPAKKRTASKKTIVKEEGRAEGSKAETTPSVESYDKKTSDFLEHTRRFFKEKGVEVLEEFPSLKKGQHDFRIRIEGTLGSFEYFCRARDKKTINEDDLSSAYLRAQMNGLPCILLTDGRLTKRASEMLRNEFKNMVVKNFQ